VCHFFSPDSDLPSERTPASADVTAITRDLFTTRLGSRRSLSVHTKERFAMIQSSRVAVRVVTAGCIAAFALAVVAYANGDDRPSNSQIAFAQEVSGLMVNEVVAALFQEFNETTPQNVEHGRQAISLIFNDLNRDMRLIGTFGPLQGGDNDRPDDRFERTALKRALGGEAHTSVQKVNDTWYYRRSVPLSNTLHQACVLCHRSFTPEFFEATNNPGQWVGALVVRIPIRSTHDHHQ
jgi:hypothetical protein